LLNALTKIVPTNELSGMKEYIPLPYLARLFSSALSRE